LEEGGKRPYWIEGKPWSPEILVFNAITWGSGLEKEREIGGP